MWRIAKSGAQSASAIGHCLPPNRFMETESRLSDGPVGSDKHFAGCDGFITNQTGLALGIHVADCCAVYIIDPNTPRSVLCTQEKRGTQLAVAAKAIEQMGEKFESDPAKMIVQLSPCIRPPHYETDFAAKIVEQCRAQGVQEIHDGGVCTACHVDLYYSYRAKKDAPAACWPARPHLMEGRPPCRPKI